MRFAVVLLLILPGCLDLSEPGGEATVTEPDHIRAPVYEVGQWWDIHLLHERTGNEMDFRRIVADVNDTHWFMGMPADAFLDYVMIVHFPPMGEVTRDELWFDAHDEEVHWLDFPLYEGKRWSASYYWTPDAMNMEVTSVHGDVALVQGTGTRDVSIWYNTTLGTPERVHIDGYLDYHVTAHGVNHTGEVMIPVGQDLVFYEGRTSGEGNADFSPGIEDIDVPLSGYDRASFALLLYDGQVNGVGASHIEATATAPDGTTFTASNDAQTEGNVFEAFAHSPVDGTWQFDATVVGTGTALLEGIAYQVQVSTTRG